MWQGSLGSWGPFVENNTTQRAQKQTLKSKVRRSEFDGDALFFDFLFSLLTSAGSALAQERDTSTAAAQKLP